MLVEPTMRRILIVFLILLITHSAWGQAPLDQLIPPVVINYNTINPQHPLMRGLLGWWVTQPVIRGGNTFWNVLSRFPMTVIGTGWQPTTRALWPAEMRLNGTSDYLSLGNVPTWDMSNTTFTFGIRFRIAALGGSSAYLLGFRSIAGSTGGYFLRVNSDSTLNARIMSSGAAVQADRSSVLTVYGNTQWHTAVAVFTTDTTTSTNNTVTIYGDGVVDQGALSQPGSTGYVPCTTDVPACILAVGTTHDFVTFLNGAVDDVRLWTRGLSAQEALMYHRQSPPEFGGMVQPEPWSALVPTAPGGTTRHRGVIQ